MRLASIGLQDVLELVLVGAVDGELEALAQELVLDVLHAVLERQQALATGPLGELDDRLNQGVRVALLGEQGALQRHEHAGEVLEQTAGEGDAERAAEDQDERRQQEHLADAPASMMMRTNTAPNATTIPTMLAGSMSTPGCSWTTLVGSASVSTVDRSGTACAADVARRAPAARGAARRRRCWRGTAG